MTTEAFEQAGLSLSDDTLSKLDIDHQIWDSTYATCILIELDEFDENTIKKSLEHATHYFAQNTVNRQKKIMKDAFFVVSVPEMPKDAEGRELVAALRNDTTISRKIVLNRQEDSIEDLEFLAGLNDGQSYGSREASSIDEEGIYFKLDAPVTVLHGYNNTNRVKVIEQATRSLKMHKKDAKVYDLPLVGLDDVERVEWLNRLRATVIQNPDTRYILSTNTEVTRNLACERILQLHKEIEDPLRLVCLMQSMDSTMIQYNKKPQIPEPKQTIAQQPPADMNRDSGGQGTEALIPPSMKNKIK